MSGWERFAGLVCSLKIWLCMINKQFWLALHQDVWETKSSEFHFNLWLWMRAIERAVKNEVFYTHLCRRKLGAFFSGTLQAERAQAQGQRSLRMMESVMWREVAGQDIWQVLRGTVVWSLAAMLSWLPHQALLCDDKQVLKRNCLSLLPVSLAITFSSIGVNTRHHYGYRSWCEKPLLPLFPM